MLRSTLFQKELPLSTVLMDTWYATNRLMLLINDLKKTFYCTIKSNRFVSRVDQLYDHIPVTELTWSQEEDANGIRLHLNKMRSHFHVQMFRIMVSTHRTEYVVTNDLSQYDVDGCA